VDSPISLQDVANIVTFLAPGYFAMQMYALVYAKKERAFSRIFVESIIYSLPIVALTNVIWEQILRQPTAENLNAEYSLLLLLVAIIGGRLAALMRIRWPIKNLAARWGLGSPDEDFVKTQLLRVDALSRYKSSVTVTLKRGSVFSGTVDRISRYAHNGSNYYCFKNLAWFDKEHNKWDERKGNLIVSRAEIEYIETPELQDDQFTS
jgi:hypothetical protein